MKKKKTKHVYVLSVDIESGDGPDYFAIREEYFEKDEAHISKNFPQMLFSVFPPPKVEVLKLTPLQWKKACARGRERMK